MTTSYPGGLDSFTNPTGADDQGTAVGGRTHSQMHADINDAVEAMQAELGTQPSGASVDVAARLSAIEADVSTAEGDIATIETTLGAGAAGGSDVATRLADLEAGGGGGATTVSAARTTTSAVSSFVAMPENIVKVGTTYWLLYSVATTTTSLHLASSSSPEGPWTAYGEILTCGSLAWETSSHTNGGSLLYYNGTYYLFYSCDTTSGAIGVATASTITGPYTKQTSPVLTVGGGGAWDSRRVQEPHVERAPDGTWVMSYMGETTAVPKDQSEKIGIATATDLLGPWTKSTANPVIGFGSTGEFDQGGAADPALFYDGELWWCLYSGLGVAGAKPWRLGLAYATDPEGPWTKVATNPILGPGATGAFDANSVWRGAIYQEGGVTYLPYGGVPASAASADAKVGSALITGIGERRLATLEDLERFRPNDVPITVTDLSSGAEVSGRIMQADGSGGVAWADAPTGGGGGTGALPTAWATYTPTWTGATTNPTLGTGGQIKGRYRRFGYNIEGRIELVVGTGATAGSGIYYFSLPPGVTAATPVTGVSYAVGAGWVYSTTNIYAATASINSADPTKFRVTIPTNVWSSSQPLTTSGNLATFTFSFETQESAFG